MDFLSFVISSASEGLSFEGMRRILKQMRHCQIIQDNGKPEDISRKAYSVPDHGYLVSIVIYFVKVMMKNFRKEFEKIPCNYISLDHTFKVAKFVKLTQDFDENERREQFSSMLFILGERGCIKSFALTRSEKLSDISEMLEETFKSSKPETVYTDNCCKDRSTIKANISENCEVKLTFHAIQRLSKTLKISNDKPQLTKERKKKTNGESKLIMRNNEVWC